MKEMFEKDEKIGKAELTAVLGSPIRTNGKSP